MTKYAKFIIIPGLIIASGYTVWAIDPTIFYSENLTPEERLVRSLIQRNEAIAEANSARVEAYTKAYDLCRSSASGSSEQILAKYRDCKRIEEPKLEPLVSTGSTLINGTASLTPISEAPPKGYTAKHSLILSGSHDYRIYSDRLGASWKNNNPSGLTWGVSNTLKSLWKERGIEFEKGTLRPKREGGNYILFSSIEHGLRAKVIAIRERWGNATVGHFLAGWGTDYVRLSFPTSKIIKDLSEEEFAELFIQQLKKESPGLVSQLVEDGILIIN